METCVLCKKQFESDEPAVLFVNKYGNRRVLCPDCEHLIDTATDTETTEEMRQEAKAAIVRMAKSNLKDQDAIDVLNSVLEGETSPEETPEDQEAEEMWEETRAEEEEEKKESFLDYMPLLALGLALIGFAVWWFFF